MLCEYFTEGRNYYTGIDFIDVKLGLSVKYPQERDWTCGLACLRTMLFNKGIVTPSEEEYIENYDLKPGPIYVKDFLEKNIIPNDIEFWTTHGYLTYGKEPNLYTINFLLQLGMYVMVESCINYAHWIVIFGYCTNGHPDKTFYHTLLIYDPFYDEFRVLHADEFESMWLDFTGRKKEFIAL